MKDMRDIHIKDDPDIFDSPIIPVSYHAQSDTLKIRNLEKAKGQINIPWHDILRWIDELWDMYDTRTVRQSKVIDKTYYPSVKGVSIGQIFYISWRNLMKFTDELWEIWDTYKQCA